jgi:hypothetical protein
MPGTEVCIASSTAMPRPTASPAAAAVRVLLKADTAAVEGDGRVEALRLADGTVLPADLAPSGGP